MILEMHVCGMRESRSNPVLPRGRKTQKRRRKTCSKIQRVKTVKPFLINVYFNMRITLSPIFGFVLTPWVKWTRQSLISEYLLLACSYSLVVFRNWANFGFDLALDFRAVQLRKIKNEIPFSPCGFEVIQVSFKKKKILFQSQLCTFPFSCTSQESLP